jgi:hypothetical protein
MRLVPQAPQSERGTSLSPIKTYTSLEDYFQAVCKAHGTGKAKYWSFVNVRKNEEKTTVELVCTKCETAFSAHKPSDSVGRHFVQREDSSWTCKKLQRAQEQLQSVLDVSQIASTSTNHNRILSLFSNCEFAGDC